MLENLKKRLARHGQFAGVEYLQVAGRVVFRLVVLKRKGQSVDFEKRELELSSWEEVKKAVGEEMPVFLAINLRGIIHRMIQAKQPDDEAALQLVLAGSKLEEFYVQRIPATVGEVVSVARRGLVDDWIKEAQERKLTLLGVCLGPFVVERVLGLISGETELQTSTHNLQIQGSSLENFVANATENSTNLRVGDEGVDSRLLVAFAAAFSGIMGRTGISVQKLAEQKDEFVYRKLYRGIGFGVLAFFFFGLLASYLSFSSYQTANQDLELELMQKDALIAQRDTLKAQYERQAELFGGSKASASSRTSMYADQLAASLPSTIQLIELRLFPQIKFNEYSSELKPHKYETNKIYVKGHCSGSVYYNNWKRALSELWWVESLHGLSYQDINDDVGIFELEVFIKS